MVQTQTLRMQDVIDRIKGLQGQGINEVPRDQLLPALDAMGSLERFRTLGQQQPEAVSDTSTTKRRGRPRKGGSVAPMSQQKREREWARIDSALPKTLAAHGASGASSATLANELRVQPNMLGPFHKRWKRYTNNGIGIHVGGNLGDRTGVYRAP
jgi:hypothetical protein